MDLTRKQDLGARSEPNNNSLSFDFNLFVSRPMSVKATSSVVLFMAHRSRLIRTTFMKETIILSFSTYIHT